MIARHKCFVFYYFARWERESVLEEDRGREQQNEADACERQGLRTLNGLCLGSSHGERV